MVRSSGSPHLRMPSYNLCEPVVSGWSWTRGTSGLRPLFGVDGHADSNDQDLKGTLREHRGCGTHGREGPRGTSLGGSGGTFVCRATHTGNTVSRPKRTGHLDPGVLESSRAYRRYRSQSTSGRLSGTLSLLRVSGTRVTGVVLGGSGVEGVVWGVRLTETS